MRRSLKYFAFVLLLAASCAKEIEVTPQISSVEGLEHDGKVTFNFTPVFGDDAPGTKAFADRPYSGGATTIQNIYFAVFDANGYKLSEYAAAVPNTYAVENAPAEYSYSVELTVTDQPRIIHIIANAPDRIPYGSEAEVIGSLMKNFNPETWDGEDAYWERIYLEHGVWAQPDPTNPSAPGYAEKLQKYLEVRDILSEARLVRNFAKITVVNGATDNFQASRFWITNVPDKGSVAPYNRNTKAFQIDYNSYANVDALRGSGSGQGNYQGFLPASATLCSLDGKSSAWLDAHANTVGSSTYCYEREVPKADPLYIIVEGKYDSDDDDNFDEEDYCYYKIDLRDDNNEYFPILRNFDYRINVHSVKSKGVSSVEAALSAAPSGDISTSLGLQELTNISNGVSQIAVSETSRVIVGTDEETDDFTIQYKYIPDLTQKVGGNPVTCNNILEDPADIATAIANHDSYVTIEYTSGITGDVFNHTGGNPWTIGAADDASGFRTITFHPVAAAEIVKTEEVTITGHFWNASLNNGTGGTGAWDNMSRVITYRLREKLAMSLEVTPTKVPDSEGEAIDLTIGIESGLPSSVFTLDMRIETGKLSLTTNNESLPLETGPSSIPGSTAKSSFSFVKAITWEEYEAAQTFIVPDGAGGEMGMKYFTCHFKTNNSIADNADDIYVSNQYFIQNHVGFTTYSPKTFTSMTVSPNSGVHVGDAVTLGFVMSAAPSDGYVEIGLKGYEPASTETSLTYLRSDSDGYEIYRYATASATISGIQIVPFMVGNCYVRLNSDEFTAMTSSASDVRAASGGLILWADENGSDNSALDWVQPQNFKVYGNNLIVGQTAKLTVYCSADDATITIGDLATTKGSSISHEGTTLWAYTTTGTYSNTTKGNYNLSVKNGSDVIGGYTVPVYGIQRGTALTSTTHAAYNASAGTGWYIFVNTSYTTYHLRSNGTNLVGVQTNSSPDDYNSLLGFNTDNTTVNVMVPSKSATANYMNGTSNGTTLTMNTSGSSYTFQYSNGNGVRLKNTSNNRYWRQSSNSASVQISSTSSNWSVYPVTFVAP